MEKETKKIALACFIGGVVCCAVALMLTPKFWWLGLIAGAAGGYISYEFREVRKAIPSALHSAGSLCTDVGEIASELKQNWCSRPHPFSYFSLTITTPITILNCLYSWYFSVYPFIPGKFSLAAMAVILTFTVATMILGFVLGLLADIGAETEKRWFWLTIMPHDYAKMSEKMKLKGHQEVPITYVDAARWIGKGIFSVVKRVVIFFMWQLWRTTFLGLWAVISFVGLFLWCLFKLIHSEKRVLCALDGTLGGALSYLWFAPTATTLASQVLLCLFGGLLGAAFGIVNWEIVSKRWLHLDTKNIVE